MNTITDHTPEWDQVIAQELKKLEQNPNINVAALYELVTYIDLTSLNNGDHSAQIIDFIQSAESLRNQHQLPPFGAYCVFANFVTEALQQVRKSPVACVAGGFPTGQGLLKSKVAEVKEAAELGAHEIDIVINRGLMRSNEVDKLYHEVRQMISAAPKAHVKVILEVCELTHQQIYLASLASMKAGAHFIKTSTGKGAHGATLESVVVMAYAIKSHFELTGKKVGLKVAGGVSTSLDAISYRNLVGQILGEEWLRPQLFRIGASSLLKNVISDLQNA